MVSKFSLDENDYADIDPRMKPFLKGWKVVQEYKGQIVNIPDTWDSDIFPVKYFEVIKKPGDPNYPGNNDENEIGLTLWAGWKETDNSGCYDHEVEINLFIMKDDVTNDTQYNVSAEILKAGGADMVVYYNDKIVTDFTRIEERRVWWNIEKFATKIDKEWIPDMRNF